MAYQRSVGGAKAGFRVRWGWKQAMEVAMKKAKQS
jgi:hypothetical protein